MYRIHRPLLTFLLAVGASLGAQEFAPLGEAMRNYLPDSWRMGVVCNYDQSRATVEDLAATLGEGYRVTVVDLRHPDQIGAAYSTLLQQQPHVLVLMPKDPIVRDGSPFATYLVRSLGPGIPTVGTRRAALDNGALFAIGPDTGGELLVQGVRITPPEFIPPPKQGRTGPGRAEVVVLTAAQ